MSGLLEAYQNIISDCRAANKAVVKDKEDEMALKEISDELEKVMREEEMKRVR